MNYFVFYITYTNENPLYCFCTLQFYYLFKVYRHLSNFYFVILTNTIVNIYTLILICIYANFSWIIILKYTVWIRLYNFYIFKRLFTYLMLFYFVIFLKSMSYFSYTFLPTFIIKHYFFLIYLQQSLLLEIDHFLI